AATVAQASVKIPEPSAYTISNSDIICVARVGQVVGTGPFTNKSPPDVIATALDGIKGTKRGHKLRVVGWVTGAPGWSENSDDRDNQIQRWESLPAVPPAVGGDVLLFLKRRGQHDTELIRGADGPVFILSPDHRTIETVRGAAWLAYTVQPIPEVKPPEHSLEIVGTITNHSADSMWFDLRNAQFTYAEMPTALTPGERWRSHPPSPIRLGPGERREYSFNFEDLSPVPIGVPGHYWFGLNLPASVNGQGNHLPVH